MSRNNSERSMEEWRVINDYYRGFKVWPPWMGPVPRCCMSWTVEEDAELVRKWEKGDNLEYISSHHGRSPGEIEARLEKVVGTTFAQRIRDVKHMALKGKLKGLEDRKEFMYKENDRAIRDINREIDAVMSDPMDLEK